MINVSTVKLSSSKRISINVKEWREVNVRKYSSLISVLTYSLLLVSCASVSHTETVIQDKFTGEVIYTGPMESAESVAFLDTSNLPTAVLVNVGLTPQALFQDAEKKVTLRIRTEYNREMAGESYLKIRSGDSLTLLVDGTKYSFASKMGGEGFSTAMGTMFRSWSEYAYYEPITREQIKAIGDAKKVEFKLVGQNNSVTGEFSAANKRAFQLVLEKIQRVETGWSKQIPGQENTRAE